MSIVNKSCKFAAFLLNDKYKYVCRFVLNQNKKSHNNGFNRRIHSAGSLQAIISFNLSDIGEGIRDVTVKEWFVNVGDKVSQFDNICEVQSDKASVTITSRYDGVIKKLHHQIDAVALVGKPLVDIEVEDEESRGQDDTKSKESLTSEQVHVKPIENVESYTLCIPSVRRLAKQNNINLKEINGTGKNGRILKEDVIRYLEGKKPVTGEVQGDGDRTEPLSSFQRAMVKTMTEALKIPHFLYCDEIAVTKLLELRNAIKTDAERGGVKISMLPFLIKAASNALLQFPVLNATVDEKCENVTYHKVHNIGIAMDTKLGLAVPIVKNVNKLGIVEIARELNRLIESGKAGNFSQSDLKGGTFTISNIGAIGGTYAGPVILPPQVAIIAIGTSKTVPRYDESRNIIPEDIICVSGSADHRVVDGATMAKFINHLKRQVENPNLLLLNL